MNRWFERLIEQTSLAHDAISLQASLERLTFEAGFSTYAYVRMQPETRVAYSNYAPEWQDLYFKRGYSRVDPIVRDAKSRMEAFAWSLGDQNSFDRKQRQMIAEAATFGIRSGISVPIIVGWGKRAMLTLASAQFDCLGERLLNPALAATAAALLHAKLQAIEAQPSAQMEIHLKPDELTCLRWSAEGKPMTMIAVIENMSYGNVAFHIQNAKAALGVSSLPQATTLAAKLGLI